VKAVRKYIDFTVAFCVKHSSLWQTDPSFCNNLLNTIEKEMVQEMKGLVLQITRTDSGSHRLKRGIFNIVGYATHSLFGILDSDHETFYNQKISQLEEEQLDWLKLSREQDIVVVSTLRSANRTLQDIATHEMLLTKELLIIMKSVNVGNKKIETKYALTALCLVLNSHAIRLRQAVGEVKDVYDTIIQICLHWKNGIVHPQVLPPARLLEILRMSQDSFPRDLKVPIELSEAYTYQLYNIISVDVYLVKGNLVYSVQIPLVKHSVFHVVKVIPYPMKKKGAERIFTLMQPEKPFVMIDKVKGK
jgi:hypothetical protein